jgi:hypothetical protein
MSGEVVTHSELSIIEFYRHAISDTVRMDAERCILRCLNCGSLAGHLGGATRYTRRLVGKGEKP